MNQKYSLDIVNVVNDYSSWKRMILMEYLHRGTDWGGIEWQLPPLEDALPPRLPPQF